MIEKKIKVLKDHQLNTFYEEHTLIKGQVKRIAFRNPRVFDCLLRMGNFVVAGRDEDEVNPIPVVPEVSEDEIVGVDPAVEEDQNVPLDEAGEPESKETLDDQSQSEPPIEIVGRTEVDLPSSEEAPWREGQPEFEGKEERELTPEQETEGLPEPEFEEIPIEEQDKSKPSHPSFSDVHGDDN